MIVQSVVVEIKVVEITAPIQRRSSFVSFVAECTVILAAFAFEQSHNKVQENAILSF